MRLIDADALYTLFVKMKSFGELTAKKAIRCVEKAPTVDAIPVKWLEERYPIHDTYGTEAYFRKAYAIYEVIKEWAERKEDETS